MEIAAEDSKSLRRLGSVEKCACPVGYAGLSCEVRCFKISFICYMQIISSCVININLYYKAKIF